MHYKLTTNSVLSFLRILAGDIVHKHLGNRKKRLKQIRLDTITKIKNLFKSWVVEEALVRKKSGT